MSKEIIVGLDAGTSLIKFVAFDKYGKYIDSASVENKVYYREGGKAEQNLEETWNKVIEAFKLLNNKIDRLSEKLEAICITGQGDGSWPIDKEGAPVGDAALWLDGRSGDIIDNWRNSEIGPKITEITHTGLNPSMQSGQMFHIFKNEPERFNKIDKVIRCKDWIFYKLTGELVTDISESFMTWGSPIERKYKNEVFEIFNFKQMKEKLPEPVDSTDYVGKLSSQSAKIISLNEGLPIVLAPVDVVCSGIGSGFVDKKKKIGCTILGTAGIHIFTDFENKKPNFKKQLGYTCSLAGSPANAKMVSNMVASLNTDWLIEIFNSFFKDINGSDLEKKNILELFEKNASLADPAKIFYHPFISPNGERGPFVNVKARAQFLGLNTTTKVYDLVRALYESLAYACKDCYSEFGAELELLRLTGGASNSSLVRKIVGSVNQLDTQVIENSEQGAAGACMVGMIALNEAKSYEDLNDKWVNQYLKNVEKFDEKLSITYEKAFSVYKKGYENMSEFWNSNYNFQNKINEN